MSPQVPQIVGTRCGDGGFRHYEIFVRSWCGEQILDFRYVEAGKAQIEIERIDLLEFQGQEFIVPVRPCDRSVDEQTECFDLGIRPFITKDHGDLGDPQLLCGLQTQVSVDDLSITTDQARNLEAELLNAAAHAVPCPVVLARIPRIGNKPVNGPRLYLNSVV